MKQVRSLPYLSKRLQSHGICRLHLAFFDFDRLRCRISIQLLTMASPHIIAIQLMSCGEKCVHRLGDELGLKVLISPASRLRDRVKSFRTFHLPKHLSIDPRARLVDVGRTRIELYRMEFKILASLVKSAGDVVTVEVRRSMLSSRGKINAVYIRMYIRLLRIRIAPNHEFSMIISTVCSGDYKLNIPTNPNLSNARHRPDGVSTNLISAYSMSASGADCGTDHVQGVSVLR